LKYNTASPTKSTKEGENGEKIINVSTNINISVQNTTENCHAGETADNISIWKTITTDKWILNNIRGCSVELNEIPKQKFIPKPINFTKEEKRKIENELNRFLKIGVIEKVEDNLDNEFISNIFIRPKKDDRVRIILNLKQLMSYI
jgi:hypothetical protein